MLGLLFEIMFTIILLTGLLVVNMLINAKRNNLTKHRLLFKEFPDGIGEFSIFFISDIHRRKISKRLIKQLPSNVDIVIIGGDLTEGGVPFHRIENNLLLLKEIAPVYFVFGNNDYEAGKEKLENLLIKHGTVILNNSFADITANTGEKLILLGIEDVGEKRDSLELALRKASDIKGFRILISHNPAIYHKVQHTHHISLILSGHTHGGQIRLFGFGLHEKGRLHILKKAVLLISNGYGTSGVPLRLGAPAEAHLVQLYKDDRI